MNIYIHFDMIFTEEKNRQEMQNRFDQMYLKLSN